MSEEDGQSEPRRVKMSSKDGKPKFKDPLMNVADESDEGEVCVGRVASTLEVRTLIIIHFRIIPIFRKQSFKSSSTMNSSYLNYTFGVSSFHDIVY